MILPHILAATSHGLAALQTQETVNFAHPYLVIVFIGLVALAMVTQIIVMLMLAVGAMKTQKAVLAHVEEFKTKLMPLIDRSQALATQVSGVTTDLAPKLSEISAKVAAISGHMEQISALAKDKAVEFAPTVTAANRTFLAANDTVADVNRKTQQQVDRVNGMISGALDATEQLGRSLRRGIAQPGRELAGIASGLKAAVQTMFDRRPNR